MKNLMLTLAALAALQAVAAAPTFTEWHDLQVNEINRFPMHAQFFAFEDAGKAAMGDITASSRFLSLDGTWQFHWAENADQRLQDFYATNLDDGAWKTMPVPGMWELNGFGDPEYVNIGFAWRGHFDEQPPAVPTKDNHVGSYRRHITIPASWDGQQVIAHFGSVTSCIYLYVNGQFAGYAEDSKVAAEFDITPFVHTGDNLIAFQTFRWCDGSWCEDQDFWRLSGVARQSYLYCRNLRVHVDDVRLTAGLDDAYRNGTLDVKMNVTGTATVNLALKDPAGNTVATTQCAASPELSTRINVPDVQKWTAENAQPLHPRGKPQERW